jgi:hypothetical protein
VIDRRTFLAGTGALVLAAPLAATLTVPHRDICIRNSGP